LRCAHALCWLHAFRVATHAWWLQVGTLFNVMFAEALAIKEEQSKHAERAPGAHMIAGAGSPEEMAKAAREQSRQLAALPSEERAAILLRIADALEARVDEIMAANQRDVAAATGVIDNHLLQRLVLKPGKVQQLAEGIRQLANGEEPIGKILSRTEIAEVLLLPPLPPRCRLLSLLNASLIEKEALQAWQVTRSATSIVQADTGTDTVSQCSCIQLLIQLVTGRRTPRNEAA
jgi:hypothetical protein